MKQTDVLTHVTHVSGWFSFIEFIRSKPIFSARVSGVTTTVRPAEPPVCPRPDAAAARCSIYIGHVLRSTTTRCRCSLALVNAAWQAALSQFLILAAFFTLIPLGFLGNHRLFIWCLGRSGIQHGNRESKKSIPVKCSKCKQSYSNVTKYGAVTTNVPEIGKSWQNPTAGNS